MQLKNTNSTIKTTTILIIILLSFETQVFSQTGESSKNWDNQSYIGNKVATANGDWRFSGELQVRLKDDMQSLDNWFLEGVASYMLSEKIELTPDFRMSIKPDEVEYRPGFGVVYKVTRDNYQFVNQLKWQIDLDTKKNIDNGLRYAIFINHKLSDKLMSNFAFGAFYRFRDDFKGFEFVRFGPGLAYIINMQHTINFNYLISTKNNTQNWEWGGIAVIQLVININKDYKYVPAKYLSF
ncbi:MAG: DUF2490 domain-containing protein [Draconibacterium sp.]|nr:DUF2490 domain-containing protein [Draconibacterium sp.]